MIDIFGLISNIFEPASKLIDDIHTSDEEKMELNNKLVLIKNEMSSKLLDYEKSLMQEQSKNIQMEAKGASWLQRNWRPITMLTFLVLVVCDSFGILQFRLSSEAWILLKIGLGGYVVGRSAEKIVPQIMNNKNGS